MKIIFKTDWRARSGRLEAARDLCYVARASIANDGSSERLATPMKQKSSTARDAVDLMTRVERLRDEFSKSEQQIADLLLRDPHGFARLNVKEIAAKVNVSEPTVVRFCRRVGCEGFKDFKIQIIQDLAYRQASTEAADAKKPEAARLSAASVESTKGIPAEVHDAAVAALARTYKAINWQTVDSAARLIAKARRVAIYGIGGSSAGMAEEAHNRLFRLSISSVTYTDSYMQRMSATTLDERDVALFVSSTGRPKSLLDSVELAKYYGAKCIGITPRDSALGRDVDICIHLDLTQGGVSQFHPNPMRFAELYLIDCLAYATAMHLGAIADTSLKRTRASVASLHGIAPLQPIGD
jgi:RpiR family carbohydrate utilization transcriptional regulator